MYADKIRLESPRIGAILGPSVLEPVYKGRLNVRTVFRIRVRFENGTPGQGPKRRILS